MSNYPNLTDGRPFRQTVKRTISLNTTIFRFLSMKEQRYVSRKPAYRLQGQYPEIYAADYAGAGTSHSLQDFQDAMIGRFGQFDVTFDGIAYTNMYFDDSDRITFDEKSVNLYGTSINLKGFPATNFPTITVSDPVLPTLGNGVNGPQNQYPNQLFHTHSNVIVDLDDTARYAYSRISTAIPGGVLAFAMITSAEAAIFEAFFLQLAGRYGIFTLTYNGIAYTARFDTDSFELNYSSGPNTASIVLPWIAVPR